LNTFRERGRNINNTDIFMLSDFCSEVSKWEGNMFGTNRTLTCTFLQLFQISLLSLRPSKSDKSLHQKLSDESSNGDSTSVSAAETSLMGVENIVITTGTVETSADLSGAASLDNIEHTTETADDAIEATLPPQKSADGDEG
jgi:hypothetical protein